MKTLNAIQLGHLEDVALELMVEAASSDTGYLIDVLRDYVARLSTTELADSISSDKAIVEEHLGFDPYDT